MKFSVRQNQKSLPPFLSVAPFLKHQGFVEEKEYRVVALCYRHGVNEPDDTRNTKDIKFRARPDGSVAPYIALYDGPQKGLTIKSVIVGPHQHQENQRNIVEMLLEQHGLK